MAFSVEQFKKLGIQQHGARANRFEVQMSFPAPVTDHIAVESESRFMIKSASLPPVIIGNIDVGYFGRKVKVAGDRTYPDWNITVYNDESFSIRDAFEAWSNLINSFRGNMQSFEVSGSLDAISTQDYKVDIIVKQYAKTGPDDEEGVIRAYKLVGAYPPEIGDIKLDWDTNNQIETFDVTLAYDYWIPLSTTSSVAQVTYDKAIDNNANRAS